ncbi:MAG: polymerase [Treponema sp.]|nr:polymerase [Treponema sp.]
MKKMMVYFLMLMFGSSVQGQEEHARIEITGSIDWVKAEINAVGTLNLALAGVKMPAGRLRGEEILNSEYPQALRAFLLPIQVDSASTLEELVGTEAYPLAALDALCERGRGAPPALSKDLSALTGRYTVPLDALSAEFALHKRAAPIPILLDPVPSAEYTSIIVVVEEALPVHGRPRGLKSLPRPCLFPRIWDTNMDLLYERAVGEPGNKTRIVRYISLQDIFFNTPTGLRGDIAAFAGARPLRIIAQEVFGETPTDLVIDAEDARIILSSENNKALLRAHKVIFAFPAEALRSSL